jgi:DNA-binding IclR family transcriptional regulator
MRALHNGRPSQTVNLSVRQGDEIVYIDRAFSERSGMQVVRAIGGRASAAPDLDRQAVPVRRRSRRLVRAYATRTGLAGHNKNSITDFAQAGARAERWCARAATRATTKNWNWVCAAWRPAFRDDSGKLVAGLSISAPADRLQEEWLEDLVNTAAQISATLGHRHP